MKKLPILLLVFSTAFAAEPPFPGLKAIMSAEEYARAGLDKLSADQVGVIDAAVIKHYYRTINASIAQQAAEQNLPPPAAQQAAVQAAVTAERKRGWLERFGLGGGAGRGEEEPSSLTARCVGWASGNSFRLDNGQVWEGTEPITVEVAGREVTLEPRPGGHFALIVDGKNTTLRVRRIK